MRNLKVESYRQVDKKAMIHIYSGMLFSQKVNEILPFVISMGGPKDIMLNKTSQYEKDKYLVISVTCRI